MTKSDIQSREDIILIVNAFYDEVKSDEKLKDYFVHVQWDKHLPVMYDFWENVLFYTGKYSGNPMEKHKAALQKFSLDSSHFQHWVQLFTKVVNAMFLGKNAKMIVERAQNIAKIMEIKLLNTGSQFV